MTAIASRGPVFDEIASALASKKHFAHAQMVMSALNPTKPELMCDAQGRPYFLWDTDLTLVGFRAFLTDTDATMRAYSIAKLMRQAKPDDVFTFVNLAQIRADWDAIRPQLGDKREFWQWVLDTWGASRDAA